MMAKVQITKGLLGGLVGVAGAATLAVVFLLGRESARGGSRERPGSAVAAAPAPVPASAGGDGPVAELPVATPPAPMAAPVPSPQPVGPAAVARVPPPAAPAAPARPGDPVRAEVAAYFRAIEALQPASSGNPEAVAQEVAAGLGKGDTSGVDGMIQQAQTVRRRLAVMTPPAPCAGYHQELLASLDDGLDLMQALKKLVASGNPTLPGPELADRANAMKARSDSLQSQEQALKQRYCQ